MKQLLKKMRQWRIRFMNWLGMGLRARLIITLLVSMVIPLILVTVFAWNQMASMGMRLQNIAVEDSSEALNDSAVENIERMTTDTARQVAEFLYARDDDLLFLANLEPTVDNYQLFARSHYGRLIEQGEWMLSKDGQSWELVPQEKEAALVTGGVSNNDENNDNGGFHYREPDEFSYYAIPLYDEITFVGLDGVEQIKIIPKGSTKVNHPMNATLQDVSKQENTYIKAETYFEAVSKMAPGEIYVSDVIGAYVGSNYIGMYTPDNVAAAAEKNGYDIEYDPASQAYSGMENPNGVRFEGIVRFATPVANDQGDVIGYVTLALNHDHLMEFVDHLTPMNERYTQLPSAYEGNYAFIWDYQCRSICHPRHHSIVGYDPETGDPEIPWLETSIYEAWQASGIEKWTDFIVEWPQFDNQSRTKKPAPILTQTGLVGLDGRYLNNAPQCTGWMDLTVDGGSGSFYILWSNLYKLTTAAAIPYYTGQYAPSEANDYSLRGFGIVTIGAGLEDFTRPARETEARLEEAIGAGLQDTTSQLVATIILLIVVVILIAIALASSITGNITRLIKGISRFRSGERQYRFNPENHDEFGTLADSFDDMADSIVDSVKNPLSVINSDREIIYMNEMGLDFCGKTLDEVVNMPYATTSVYPEGTPYDPILALEEGRTAEIYYVEDRNAFLRGVANYLLNKDGQRNGYIIESQDMTEIVREQMQVQEQRLLLQQVFSASPDLIWYMDSHGRYLTVNPRFAAISGAKPEDFVGKTAEEMLPPNIAEGLKVNDLATIGTTKPLYSEERLVFSDGHEEILDSVRTPVQDDNGNLVGLLGFARNVSVRVSMENALRSTQLELEEAVRTAISASAHKGEFLARMSHEIRTPMNAIIGMTSIVQKRLADLDTSAPLDEVKGHVRQIEASSQHLLGLLNDILDISKIEAGKIELSEERMELTKLAQTVASIIKPRCDEKNIQFVKTFDDFEPSTFLSDSLRLRQVLINLLGNAVKFTNECGMVEFQMRRKDRRDGKTLVEFVVRDTGIGITQASLETIFQPFEQGGNNVTRRYGGTGLGLAISRSMVQLFGGEIAVHSVPDEGSTFSFELWLIETDDEQLTDEMNETADDCFAGKRMLLVDDVEINRIIVETMLENTGIDIDEANDGVAAVKAFEASEEGYYDIILMDVQMPNMDGYEAAAAIRALPRVDASAVPIIALTANAFKEDMNKALESGMNAHVAKPVEMETLSDVMHRFLGKHD